jgi:hypothetical protein
MSNQPRYQLPETTNVSYVVVDPSNIGSPILVHDVELIEALHFLTDPVYQLLREYKEQVKDSVKCTFDIIDANTIDSMKKAAGLI